MTEEDGGNVALWGRVAFGLFGFDNLDSAWKISVVDVTWNKAEDTAVHA